MSRSTLHAIQATTADSAGEVPPLSFPFDDLHPRIIRPLRDEGHSACDLGRAGRAGRALSGGPT